MLGRLLCCGAALAAGTADTPYTPSDDAEVLERLPARISDARARELAELRAAWRRNPAHLETALRLARRCLDDLARESDPRLVGCAQAAMAPWWQQSEPPLPVLVVRAVVLQYSHRFDPALVDLEAAQRLDPSDPEPSLWRLAILMVQARYDEARRQCEAVQGLTTPLTAAACRAQVHAATGEARRAVADLRGALRHHPEAPADERLWAFTRLAETEERLGDLVAAESSYRAALALDQRDVYALAAYADLLLDLGRPAEVVKLLAPRERVDVLLLRLALAARAVAHADAARWQRDLSARFDAARIRGDALHEKEEARYWLGLGGEPARALTLASRNYQVQREPADARVLLEAALAARDKAAAAPVLRWLAQWHFESVQLARLAARVEALP